MINPFLVCIKDQKIIYELCKIYLIILGQYNRKDINTIDYTYFDGRDWSNIYSAKDGVGVLELAPGCQNSTYQLKIEYEYRCEAHIDNEVESVLNTISGIPMRDAYKTIKYNESIKYNILIKK